LDIPDHRPSREPKRASRLTFLLKDALVQQALLDEWTLIGNEPTRAECEELVLRFLSTLSWVEKRGFMVEGAGLSGGNLPRPMDRDKQRGFSMCAG
jgi:hypothetical protein